MLPSMEGQALRPGQPVGLPRGGPCRRQGEEGQTSQARVRGWPRVKSSTGRSQEKSAGGVGEGIGKENPEHVAGLVGKASDSSISESHVQAPHWMKSLHTYVKKNFF